MTESDKLYRNQIILKGMRFMGKIGLLDFERDTAQPFIVDLSLFLTRLDAGQTDEISDTIDYGIVFSLVQEIVQESQFNLIEALAETIATSVLRSFPTVDALDVFVQKPEAPIQGSFDFMGVRIFRDRNGM